LTDCQHVHVTGSGAPGVELGFHLAGFSNCGIFPRKGSEHLEIDHLEIGPATKDAPRAAGIRAHSLVSDMHAGWVQHETKIHHCYLHDVGFEAMYIGKDSNPRPSCLIRGLQVHHNTIDRCGGGGIQIRNARAVDCHHNTIDRSGHLVDETHAGGGLNLSHDVQGRWHDNIIARCERGVHILHPGDGGIELYRNLIVHCGHHGRHAPQGGIRAQTGGMIHLHHNTLIGSAAYGIRVTEHETRGAVVDNLIVASGERALRAGVLNCHHNLVVGSLEDARFLDPEGGNYVPGPGSPAIGAASDGGDVGAFPGKPPDPEPEPEPPAVHETVTVTVEIGGEVYRGVISRTGGPPSQE
jgi:hypothetical protein